MILFFGDGALGNQLFQYFFIKSIEDKKHMIISYNFDDIQNLFNSLENVFNINNKYFKYLIRKVGLPILLFFARFRLISSYKIDSYIENGFKMSDITFTKRRGLFPVIFIYPCYAQSESFFQHSQTAEYKLKELNEKKAVLFIDSIPIYYNKVFVHVRRGDYIHFSVLGNVGVTLPLSYYKKCIKWFQDNIENPFFVFLTDDPEFVECNFESISNKVISRNSQFVDFSIITLCEYGIMSNSSFSWWAAYMMRSRVKVFSPKYWLGWKSKIELPKGIKPSFSEEI
jgi:hypothetical protein